MGSPSSLQRHRMMIADFRFLNGSELCCLTLAGGILFSFENLFKIILYVFYSNLSASIRMWLIHSLGDMSFSVWRVRVFFSIVVVMDSINICRFEIMWFIFHKNSLDETVIPLPHTPECTHQHTNGTEYEAKRVGKQMLSSNSSWN